MSFLEQLRNRGGQIVGGDARLSAQLHQTRNLHRMQRQTSEHRPQFRPAGFVNHFGKVRRQGIARSIADGANADHGQIQLQRQIADKDPTPRGTVGLADFLGRRGRVKEALDLYAPFWLTNRDPDLLTNLCFSLVMRPNNTAEPADLKRVSDWLTQALKSC